MFVTFAGSDSLCLSTEVHVHTHILQNGKISYLYRDLTPKYFNALLWNLSRLRNLKLNQCHLIYGPYSNILNYTQIITYIFFSFNQDPTKVYPRWPINDLARSRNNPSLQQEESYPNFTSQRTRSPKSPAAGSWHFSSLPRTASADTQTPQHLSRKYFPPSPPTITPWATLTFTSRKGIASEQQGPSPGAQSNRVLSTVPWPKYTFHRMQETRGNMHLMTWCPGVVVWPSEYAVVTQSLLHEDTPARHFKTVEVFSLFIFVLSLAQCPK